MMEAFYFNNETSTDYHYVTVYKYRWKEAFYT